MRIVFTLTQHFYKIRISLSVNIYTSIQQSLTSLIIDCYTTDRNIIFILTIILYGKIIYCISSGIQTICHLIHIVVMIGINTFQFNISSILLSQPIFIALFIRF
ncbi:unknown [Phocaeicola coprophilus CAG:333]|nr:unknown [Phocaeicola coprophilus CAG:333]